MRSLSYKIVRMLRITLIAVGKLKESYWRDAQAEYLKRLHPYAAIEVIELSDAPDSLGIEAALEREGAAILKALPAGVPVVLLDREGTQRSSEDNAAWLEQSMTEGISHLVFVIGGSNGVSAAVQAASTMRLSLGSITLAHNLARIVMLEQLYRAFKILRGEPYHK